MVENNDTFCYAMTSSGIKAYSHQAKANAKAKNIKENTRKRSTKKNSNIKKKFRFRVV